MKSSKPCLHEVQAVMFYEGNVQDGISLALQQSKSVVCFVKDEGDESQLWETRWLRDSDLPQVLKQGSVCLRIVQGSPEARMLAAVYPLSKVPTLLVINGGSIVEQIHPGTNQNDFTRRLRAILEVSTKVSQQPHDGATAGRVQSNAATTQPVEASRTGANPDVAGDAPHDSAKPSSKGKERAHAAPPTPEAPSNSKRPNDDSYAQQQVRRKKEAVQERDRVRALIEADKQERRAREERLRAERNALIEAQYDVVQSTDTLLVPARSSQSGRCGIQVRLLDGSIVRNYFSVEGTLQEEVRAFVDEHRSDGTTPYTFRLMRTPQPSRAVPEKDEKVPLKELDLLPSASLALVPVKNLAQAYQAGGSKGFLRSAPILLYAYLFALLMRIIASTRMFLGIGVATRPENASTSSVEQPGGSNPTHEESSNPEKKDSDRQKIRVRTLRDQRDESKDQQFYNGNQLNFEPKKEDET